MSLKRFILPVSAALLSLALGTASVIAGDAVAATAVNVRAGPGMGYAVIDVLDPGQPVGVEYCRGPWCLIHQPGPDGWVDANYITTQSHYYNYGYTGDVYHDSGHYAGGYYGGDSNYDDYDVLEHPHQRYRTYRFYGDLICINSPYAQICARD